MFGSPHWPGGAGFGSGGGGLYCATRANIRPNISSGGHVWNAIVPPRFSTRSISLIAISGRGANMCANWLSTTSNSPSRKGRLSTSPCFHAMSSTSAIAAFSFATARSSGVRSRPVTTAPARRAVIATTPVPHPTSRTLCPGRTPAKATSFAAVGVVIWASGANDFHASRCATLKASKGSDVIVRRWRQRFPLDNDSVRPTRASGEQVLHTGRGWPAHDDRPLADDDGRREDRALRRPHAQHDRELSEARREALRQRHDIPSRHRQLHDPGWRPGGHRTRRPRLRDQGRAPLGQPERARNDLHGERGPEHRGKPVLHQRRRQRATGPEASRVRSRGERDGGRRCDQPHTDGPRGPAEEGGHNPEGERLAVRAGLFGCDRTLS